MVKRLALTALFGAALLTGGATNAFASSHREAPLISQDPVADLTDVYAFNSPDDPSSVTFIMDVVPFENPAGGPKAVAGGREATSVRIVTVFTRLGSLVAMTEGCGGTS